MAAAAQSLVDKNGWSISKSIGGGSGTHSSVGISFHVFEIEVRDNMARDFFRAAK